MGAADVLARFGDRESDAVVSDDLLWVFRC